MDRAADEYPVAMDEEDADKHGPGRTPANGRSNGMPRVKRRLLLLHVPPHAHGKKSPAPWILRRPRDLRRPCHRAAKTALRL